MAGKYSFTVWSNKSQKIPSNNKGSLTKEGTFKITLGSAQTVKEPLLSAN